MTTRSGVTPQPARKVCGDESRLCCGRCKSRIEVQNRWGDTNIRGLGAWLESLSVIQGITVSSLMNLAEKKDVNPRSEVESLYRLELPASRWQMAAVDIKMGVCAWQSWVMLGWHDIRQRYRRSTLGPFWITITMGITIGSIGLIFGVLLGQDMHEFLPYVAAGNIVWALLSTLITDGCTTFVTSEQIIKQIKLPYSIHIFRMTWRSLIIFAHNIWVFVAAAVLFEVWPNKFTWLVIPGFILVVINGVWIALFLAIVCTRFRDIPLIVTSALQLLYLATPIIWRPSSLGSRHSYIYEYNPLYHLLELVRAPLLGQSPALVDWTAAIGLAVLGAALAFVLFARFRWRIPYWI
jgi:homopolymeric O-antigen transport system permease protein